MDRKRLGIAKASKASCFESITACREEAEEDDEDEETEQEDEEEENMVLVF